MKLTTRFLAVAAFLVLGTASAQAQRTTWGDDYTKALAQARAENKPVLLDFTGSDWCGWCMKMKKEALDTPQFNDYAQKNLVLVTVDFPRRTALPPAVKQQNDKLSAQYRADGFPTFVLVDKFGRELGRQGGYLAGGAPAFIAKLGTFYKPAPTSTQATAAVGAKGDSFDQYFHKATPAPTP